MPQAKQRRGRGRPQTLDRQHTLEIAMASYWSEGIQGVSMNEVCRRSGVSKPSVYREFGSEDGLMQAVLEHYRATVLAPLLGLLTSDLPFAEVLEQLLRFITEPSDRPAGCLFAELCLARQPLGPETEASVEAISQELRTAYEQWLRRAQARGEVESTISLDLATHFTDTQLTTALWQMARGAEPELVRAQTKLAFRALTTIAPAPTVTKG